ncbi:MAG: 1-(5-phosphoribosyl)-5-[(5-phosphoribosylamino)methylideneamino]imidazole-4-carboxamide isomerase [Bacteroidales bacterium]|nr:1-(5-phosphoribosyl)-5-[(5-phosphoribosylamino)methylideneamino]imidazole-4-carboxamide isomerase [Bacteroidales bacterium]
MIELIPAIDIIDGKCVRLTQGKYDQKKVYSGRPEEIAGEFEAMGIKRLHLVDLDGARMGQVVNLRVLEKIAGQTSLVVDFGGGIKTGEDIRQVMEAGARMVTAGSIAVKDPGLVRNWIREFGPDKIILGADVRDGLISIHGWQEDTSLELIPFIHKYMDAGIHKVICTDIATDGMLEGPSIELYREMKTAFPEMEIIASGGVSRMQDIIELEGIGVNGVIFGKAFYEGRITGDEIVNYLKSS